MIKAEVKNGQIGLEAEGDIDQLCADIGIIIHTVFVSVRKNSTEDADFFKDYLATPSVVKKIFTPDEEKKPDERISKALDGLRTILDDFLNKLEGTPND